MLINSVVNVAADARLPLAFRHQGRSKSSQWISANAMSYISDNRDVLDSFLPRIRASLVREAHAYGWLWEKQVDAPMSRSLGLFQVGGNVCASILLGNRPSSLSTSKANESWSLESSSPGNDAGTA